MTLSARVDAILVVTRLGVVNRPMLTDLSRELEGSPASKLGFVVTGVDLKAGYGHGYGHVYGQPAEAALGEPSPASEPATDVAAQRAARRGTRKTPAGR